MNKRRRISSPATPGREQGFSYDSVRLNTEDRILKMEEEREPSATAIADNLAEDADMDDADNEDDGGHGDEAINNDSDSDNDDSDKGDSDNGNGNDMDNDNDNDNDNDIDIDGDSDDDNEIYDAAKEGLPYHVAYDITIANIKYVVNTDLDRYTLFADNGQPPLCEDMVPLVQRYEEVKAYPPPKPIVIALIGAASAGKSSVINSVLDCKDLAETGAAGSSCTNVVTEFSAAPPEQKERFSATIKCLKSRQILQLLRQHMDDVLATRHADTEDLTSDERAQGLQKLGTAVTTFTTIFADRNEFRSRDVTESTLKLVSEDNVDAFLRPLLSRCVELTVATTQSAIAATSAKKLNKKLAPFTQPNASSSVKVGRNGAWPLVEMVQVTLRDWHVLNGLQNLTFADVPGLQDENLVRVEAAKRYIASCDAIWVVCNISRVKDNAETAGLLDLAIKRCGNKAALIVTCADSNLNEKTFNALRHAGLNISECKSRLARKKEVERLFAQAVKKAKSNKLDRENKQQARLITERLKMDCEDADYYFKDSLMSLRNQSVVENKRESTKSKFPKGTRLQVFCVANEIYQSLDAPGISQHINSAAATNIPALRHYALELPTTTIFKSAKHHVTGPFHDFVFGVESWTKDSFIRDSELAIEAVEAIRSTAVQRVLQHSNVIDQITEDNIFDHVRKNADEYTSTAIKVSQSWERYRWHAYSSRCRQHGLLRRKDGSNASSWNEELTAKLSQDMAEPCFTMSGHKQSMEVGIVSTELVNDMRSIKTALKSNVSNLSGLEDFGAQIERQCDKIKELLLEDFAAQAALIRELNVRLSTDVYMSIPGRIMKPAYEECAKQHGKGMQRRMYNIMREHMTGAEKPFASKVLDLLQQDYYTARQGRGARLAEKIGIIFRKISENLRMMAAAKTSDNALVDDIRTDVATRVAESLPLFEELVDTFKELEASASGFGY